MAEKQINVMLFFGGGGEEHEISLISAKKVENTLRQAQSAFPHLICHPILIAKDGSWWRSESGKKARPVALRWPNLLQELDTHDTHGKVVGINPIDYAIPCLHGPPGETGDIQTLFQMAGLDYFGSASEGHRLCFNKISTKAWLEAHQFPPSPWIGLTRADPQAYSQAHNFLKTHTQVYLKAAQSGSSIGCFRLSKADDLEACLEKAFQYGPWVILEKEIVGRELEVAVFEQGGEIVATHPGEISLESQFYSYEEKYSTDSQAHIRVEAPNLAAATVTKMQEYARSAFKLFNLRHLARVDFFLTVQGEIVINEINTMPGLTPISLFIKMLEATGLTFEQFLLDKITQLNHGRS